MKYIVKVQYKMKYIVKVQYKMKYIVKVQYKNTPDVLLWTYSGRQHPFMQAAIQEASEAKKNSDVDKVFVSAVDYPEKEEPEKTSDLEKNLNKAICGCIDSVDKLIKAAYAIDEETPISAYLGVIFSTVLDDYISQKRVTVGEAVSILEASIQALKKYGGKI